MAQAILRGTVDIVVSPDSELKKPLSFDGDEILHIYIEDISQVPKTDIAQEHPKSYDSILLGETRINLSQNHKFPLEFQFEYDSTKVSNGQFDKLCDEGLIVVGAEVNADGRDMTTFWLKSGAQKFEQNIKLTLTDSY
jgi:hypothetical protein